MIEIRLSSPTDAPALAKVHVDTWRTAYAGIVPQEYLDSLDYAKDYAKRTERWTEILARESEGCKNLVLTLAGEIIGFASTGPNRTPNTDFDGELYAIYLLQVHHGRGYGKALLNKSMQCLWQDGFSSMLVWVLADNATCGFYASMGGKLELRYLSAFFKIH